VVIDGGGGDSARHAELFSSWIEKADELGSRKILYVRDRDELPTNLVAKLDASTTVFLLPCRELENLLLDFDAVAATLSDAGGKPVDTVEVEAQARTFAEELKDTIVLKRVSWDLGIHRHVDHRLRDKLARLRLGKDAFTEALVKRLPSPDEIRSQIDAAWENHTADVGAAWEKEWAMLVPGADLLDMLWKHYLGRNYKKADDGLLIAQNMAHTPAVLEQTLSAFMAP
jgi:hypothetical protein